uniref:VWFA domain-containing protein n=1 Tax=Acrobeloides nanus TaxID=290746 RepID=A0A914CK42_9BILA
MSSTTHPIYKNYEELCEKLLHRLKIGLRYTRVALVTFNSVGGTYTHFDLDRYDSVEDVVNEIRNLVYTGGTTAIGAGIEEAMKQNDEQHGARMDKRYNSNKIMIVFTDGWNNKGPEPEVMAKKAKAAGFDVYAVGVNTFTAKDQEPDVVPLNDYTLEAIAQDQKHKFTNENFDQLIDIVRRKNVKCL